jgi:outer membrane lipoprotein carrier protein
MAERVRALTLIVSPAGVIQNMNIEETDGAVTDFSFTNIEENVAIPPSDFIFTPPPGTTIVNAQSPI